MPSENRLRIASVFFAVLWTAGMVWADEDRSAVSIALLVVAGAIAGALWYLAMRWVFRFLHQRTNLLNNRS